MSRVVALVLLVPWTALAQVDAEPAAASDARSRVARAVEAYSSALDTTDRELRGERFRQAERLFGGALALGVENADLYTNQGNAALQAGRLGGAVVAYRRALRLDPDHDRALQNLDYARSLLPEWVPRRERSPLFDSFFFWHRSLSRSERATGGAVLFALACALGGAAVRWRSPLARTSSIVLAAGWAALLVSLLLDSRARLADEVVLTAPETVVRSADSIHAPARFAHPLPAGTEARVVERREGWLRIRMASGRDGWVQGSSATRVLPGG